jgi:molybdopterin synthase catalytic subunit
LFFGILKDLTGRSEDVLELGSGARLGAVFDHYAGRFPRLREMERSIVLARNQQFSDPAAALDEGDEIAFLPPVSGGASPSPQNYFALTREPIDTRKLAALVRRDEDGAVVAFEGVARNNTRGRRTLYLDYECYEPMALQVMAELGDEIARSRPIGRIAIVHRLGRIEIGETSVAVLTGAPHRRPAFEAALEAIDRLKRIVPIWKKEHFEDGEVWVEGEWDASVPKQS